jgi:hypothetical protein
MFLNGLSYCINILFGDVTYRIERTGRDLMISKFLDTIPTQEYYAFFFNDTMLDDLNNLDVGTAENSIMAQYPEIRSISLLDKNPNKLLCENFVYDYGSIFDIIYEGDFKTKITSIINT